MSLSLLVGGLQAPVFADPVTSPQAADPVAGRGERPDRVSAMVSARASGVRVEDVSQRDEFSRVFANPDGTWTSESASEPERVRDGAGEWHEIDTTLVESAGGWAPAYAATDLVLSDGGEKRFAGVSEDGRDLTWSWPTTLPAPTVEGDTATYADVVPGGDLVVRALATGFSHSLVLHERPAGPVEVTIPVRTDGATLSETPQGGLTVETGAGREVVSAPQPLMWDASGNAVDGPEHVAPVDTAVGQSATGVATMTLSPDPGFLADPETVYPVTVDPSFTTYTNGDAWVQNAGFTDGQTGSPELRAGTYDGGGHKARSFIHFDGNNASKWAGKHVVSANMVLRNFYSDSCASGAIRANRVLDDWNGFALTWGNQPGVGALSDDYSPAKGASANCPEGDATWDVAGIVQAWADGGANYGVRLKAVDETANNTWRKYRSANYGTQSHRPHINVTYDSYPDTPTVPPVVTPGNTGYATSTTPTFEATVSDLDLGNVRGVFEVQGPNLSWTGISPYVGSGGKATLAIPAGKLTNGGTYTVKVQASDGTNVSKGYSPSATFTVDTVKPGVAVSASSFTNGQWRTDVPASNTFTLDGSGDTTSFSYTLDGVAHPGLAANGNGDATISWLPTSGSHTLSATPTDRAGNLGAPATFSFGVGAASFTTPTDSARSTGVFPIEIAGPPGATSAEVSWRYADQDATAWLPATGVKKTSTSPAWDGTVTNTSDGRASTSGALVWDATKQDDPNSTDPAVTLEAPALIELRGCFTYASAPSQVCSSPRQVQLVPSAFGGNFPVTTLGPATVALFTGEATITEPDAVDTAAGVGRTFSSFDASTTTAGAFGKGWSTSLFAAGDTAELLDRRDQDGTLVLVTAGDASQTFTPLDAGDTTDPIVFRPAGLDDDSRMVLDGTTITLTRPLGPVTTWQHDTAQGTWVLQETTVTDTNGSAATSVASTSAGYPTWIAQTPPGASPECTAAVQAANCRGLKLTYTGTGTAARVTKIERVAHGTTPSTVATYTYANDRLDTVCGPDPAPADPQVGPLCAHYDYDTTTVAGRTLLASATPPGQQPWTFAYDTTGRLTTVTRALDTTTNQGGTGPATWTVAYDLNPTATGLPDLSAATAAQWGQADLPTRAAAVFTPAHVPAATPSSSDLEHASLWYSDADGTTTNTAVHANTGATSQWLLDTSWYDQYGNVVRTLDGAGRARALAAPVDQRPGVAAEASSWTRYNDDGDQDHDDGDGTRVEDEYAPVHTATLKDGTTGRFRAHTAYTYDDQAPALGGDKPTSSDPQEVYDLVVEIRHSAAGADMLGERDVTVVDNEYAPVVAGDGDGWELGTPTRVKTKLADGTWSTQVTRYDTQGRQIETRQPGGGTAADGSGNDAHATTTTYYRNTNPADPACATDGHANRAEWVGLVCKTRPAGQPAGAPMPVTYQADYNTDLQPTRVEETSGNTTRVTTLTYDGLGRPVTTTTTDGADTRTTTTGYSPTTGLATTSSGTGGTVTSTYDTWGRAWKYTDATGLTSTTTYTADSQVATADDGQGTYTYTYDGASGERRRLPTAVDVGLPGSGNDTFTLSYDAAGTQSKVAYPNGTVATYGHDEIGAPTALDYTDATGTALLSFTATVDVDGRVLANTSTASAQDYTYDALGRLTKVRDTREAQCTTRTYGFSAASERTSFTSYAPAADGTCQTTTAGVSKTNTYDTANRITNTGYTYDNLGRTLTTPAADTAPGATSVLTASYYANDMAKSLTQTVDNGLGGTVTKDTSYGLDATGRINTVTNKSNGTETNRLRYRFSNDTDSPTSIQTSTDTGTTWTTTRYLVIPGLGMAATIDTNGQATYQLANLHGDITATQTTTTGITTYTETDEYGNNPTGTSTARYGWLGTHQRSTDTTGGLTLMGARLYNPTTGLFLSADPILNGGANRYSYPTDPINQMDLTGQWWCYSRCKAAIVAGMAWVISDMSKVLCSGASAGYLLCVGSIGAISSAAKYFITQTWAYGRSVTSSLLASTVAQGVGGFLLGVGLGQVSILRGKTGSAIYRSIKKVGLRAVGYLRGRGFTRFADALEIIIWRLVYAIEYAIRRR